jgi:hypothetical protein
MIRGYLKSHREIKIDRERALSCIKIPIYLTLDFADDLDQACMYDFTVFAAISRQKQSILNIFYVLER